MTYTMSTVQIITGPQIELEAIVRFPFRACVTSKENSFALQPEDRYYCSFVNTKVSVISKPVRENNGGKLVK